MTNRPVSVLANRKTGLDWKVWNIGIHLDTIKGGKPAGSLHEAWAEGAVMDGDQRIKQEIIRLAAEAGLRSDDEVPQGIKDLAVARAKANVFLRDDEGNPCITAAQIKAGMKESASILWQGDTWTKTKKQTKSWIPERIFVEPDLIPMFDQFGKQVEPEVRERPVSPKATNNGRAALSAAEYLENVVCEFTVRLLVARQDNEFTDDHLADLLECFSYEGLGAERSLGFGTFVVVKFDRVQ